MAIASHVSPYRSLYRTTAPAPAVRGGRRVRRAEEAGTTTRRRTGVFEAFVAFFDDPILLCCDSEGPSSCDAAPRRPWAFARAVELSPATPPA